MTNTNNKFTISIFDINGQLLLSKKINKNLVLSPSIDSGIYFLEINSSEKSYSKKIIRL